jgi:hypothetical protein
MQQKNGGDFNATGVKTSCVAGTTNVPGRTVIASRVIPAGAKAFLEKWSAKVVDIGNADQIYFAILKNGSAVQSGMERIPAIQFDYQAQIELNVLLTPGLVEIVAYNISGMATSIEADALAAVAVNCQAWWSGSLTSERGGIS